MTTEIEIVKFFSSLGKGTFIDSLSWFISLSSVLIIILVASLALIFVYDRKKFKKFLICVIFVLIIHFIITDFAIKSIGGELIGIRERPYLIDSSISEIGYNYTNSSFPSGHVAALASVLVVFCYFYRNKILWIGSFIFILIMMFSRIHNGMHYPSDVLFGALFGIIYGLIAVKIINRIKIKL